MPTAIHPRFMWIVLGTLSLSSTSMQVSVNEMTRQYPIHVNTNENTEGSSNGTSIAVSRSMCRTQEKEVHEARPQTSFVSVLTAFSVNM